MTDSVIGVQTGCRFGFRVVRTRNGNSHCSGVTTYGVRETCCASRRCTCCTSRRCTCCTSRRCVTVPRLWRCTEHSIIVVFRKTTPARMSRLFEESSWQPISTVTYCPRTSHTAGRHGSDIDLTRDALTGGDSRRDAMEEGLIRTAVRPAATASRRAVAAEKRDGRPYDCCRAVSASENAVSSTVLVTS